jgi:hypothetical protein
MMLLKHFRDWSFEDLTREVRANLVYREFTRIGGGKVPVSGGIKGSHFWRVKRVPGAA